MKNLDHLHFNWGDVLSYNKTWNFVIGERESGKSVSSWLYIWSAFHYQNRPTIVLRRRVADITTAYIDDIATVLNKFLEKPVQILYMKGDVKTGVVDLKLGEADKNYTPAQVKKLPIFCRVIGLSIPMNRIKSLMIPNIKYLFMDEFIANLRGGETYLKADEYFLIKEIYTTYNREAEKPIRIICCGNPYSVYTPLFMGLGVNSALIKPAAFITGPNYVIDCFQAPQELKEKILANNPMYQFDDAYKRYAFGGEAVNDAYIPLQKTEPKGYKLDLVFKLGKDYLSVHRGSGEFKYWVCKHKSDWVDKVSKNRNIFVFNFADMIAGTVKLTPKDRLVTINLKDAMDKRQVCYNCIDASYMLEDLYPLL